MSSTRPYYRKTLPSPTMQSGDFLDDGRCVDLSNVPAPAFGANDPVAQAVGSFDDRAAALISAAVAAHARDKLGNLRGIRARPEIIWENRAGKMATDQPWFQDWDLSEFKWYNGKAPSIFLLRAKCLAVMAYLDYFPDVNWPGLRAFVSSVVQSANTGWCGTFGPGVDDAFDIAGDPAEGNYDMNQMHLIPLAYRHYQDLTPPAREQLI